KTAVSTGLRLGELAGLQRGDVNLAERTITVRRSTRAGVTTKPKSGRERTVDLLPAAAMVLRGWFEQQGVRGRDQLVFPRATDPSKPLNAPFVTRRRLRPAMEKAGVPTVGPRGHNRGFHSFRSTFARIVMEQPGTSLYWLQQQLGHESMRMTE